MKNMSKIDQIKDYIIKEILRGHIRPQDRVNDKKYFTSKFKVNPKYLDDVFADLLDRNIIENRDGQYFFIFDQDMVIKMRNEALNTHVNEFIREISDIGLSLDEAIDLLNLRNIANG